MPLRPVDRILLQKAAIDEGFGIEAADDGDWLSFSSLGSPAALKLTSAGAGYVAATDHGAVIGELKSRWPTYTGAPPPGFTTFVADSAEALHRLVGEIWRLARALPQAPLSTFEEQVRNLPRTTEAERLVVQRVGQDVFRAALMDYWDRACAVTGIAEPSLLRASHIKPWAKCDTDAERLDVFNGLLLAAHLDAAFDGGLISFNRNGGLIVSPRFRKLDQEALGIHEGLRLRRTSESLFARFAWHREHIFRRASDPQAQ